MKYVAASIKWFGPFSGASYVISKYTYKKLAIQGSQCKQRKKFFSLSAFFLPEGIYWFAWKERKKERKRKQEGESIDIYIRTLQSWLSDLEVFTSLLAAIIHDFDHTGTTNNFHINSGSELTLLYNDRAVLENHHVSAFFRTIQKKDCNVFGNMQKSDFREFRNLIIEMVLHTDMSQHFSQLKAMKTVLQQHNGEPR